MPYDGTAYHKGEVQMKRTILIAVIAAVLVVALAGAALAVKPHEFPSTNAQNESLGQPFVRQVDVGEGYVVLEFVNSRSWYAFFEVRVDGKKIPRGQGDPHLVVLGDVMYEGIGVQGTGISPVIVRETFEARKKVEIRLALGGERDWDFDWTTFKVER